MKLRFCRSALTVTCAVGAIGTFGLRSASAADPTFQFDIPAETLGQAVSDVSQASSQQIIFSNEVVAGKRSSGLHGRYTPSQALDALLAGTDLKVEVNASGVLMVRSKNVQAAQNEGAAHDGLSGSSATPETVVVTAEKRVERLQDVPVPVTAISSERLLNYNETRLQDFASTIPGVVFSPGSVDGGFGYLSIRGIAPAAGNPTVGVLIDDVPFGGITAFGSGNAAPDIDPNDLARVEVLRGPQGTLYGSSSMGGLLKFVTKDPSTDSFSGNVSAQVSSVYNGAEPGYSTRASFNIPVDETLALRVSGFARQDPGYVDNPYLHVNGLNEAHAFGGRFAVLWKPVDWFSLKLNALVEENKQDGSSDIMNGPGYPSSLGTFQPGFPTGPLGDLQQDYYPGINGFKGLSAFDRIMQNYSAVANFDLGSVDLTSVTSLNVNHYNDAWDFTPSFGACTLNGCGNPAFGFGVAGTPVTDDVTSTKVTEELRLSGSFWHFDWLVGGFFEHEHTPIYEHILAENISGNVVGTWANWFNEGMNQEEAIFTNWTYHFSDRFDVQVGARESHLVVVMEPNTFSGIFNAFIGSPPVTHSLQEVTKANVFTYLVTPSYKLSDDTMIYARMASGYRPGTNNGQVPNATVPAQSSPDKTQDYELGLKSDFLDHRLSIDGSLYYIDWADLQVNVAQNGFGYTSNAGDATSKGVELSATARPLDGLTISGWVSYNEAAINSLPTTATIFAPPGSKLPFSARWTEFASIQQDYPLTPDLMGFVAAQASFVGDRKGAFPSSSTDYRQDYPGYVQVDMRLGATYSNWTANLFLNNVADERGLIGGGAGTNTPIGFQYITPRTVGLNISRAF